MLKWLAYQNETEATLSEIGIGRKNRQENVCNQYVCDSGASKWYVGSRHIIQLTQIMYAILTDNEQNNPG